MDGMNVMDAILGRRSVRKFESRPVPREALDQIMEAMRWAPSAGNLQSRFFYFVTNSEKRKELAKAALNQSHVAQAPVCIVACADMRIAQKYSKIGEDVFALLDVATAVENGMLIAHSLGLGTCWVGAIYASDVKELLGMPAYLKPVALIPLGYPAEKPEEHQRKRMEDVAKFIE